MYWNGDRNRRFIGGGQGDVFGGNGNVGQGRFFAPRVGGCSRGFGSSIIRFVSSNSLSIFLDQGSYVVLEGVAIH